MQAPSFRLVFEEREREREGGGEMHIFYVSVYMVLQMCVCVCKWIRKLVRRKSRKEIVPATINKI